MKRKISVIVCTYNQEDVVSRCLDAILAQKCNCDFEVVIGEDGSKDNTRAVCEEYAQRYPDIVRLMPKAPNKGIIDNYYDCVRAASGEYIMECGGDDEWCAGRMQRCLDVMEQHESVVQMFTDMYYRSEETGEVTEHHNDLFAEGLLKGKEMIEKMMQQNCRQMVSYAMTRRDKMLEVMTEYPQFFSGRRYFVEDKQLTTLLATKGDMYNITDCTYYYTTNNASITHTSERKLYDFNKNMLQLSHDLAEAVHFKGSLRAPDTEKLYIMTTRVFLAGDEMLRKDLLKTIDEYDVIPTNTMRLLLYLSKNKPLWRIARSMYRLIYSK